MAAIEMAGEVDDASASWLITAEFADHCQREKISPVVFLVLGLDTTECLLLVRAYEYKQG